MYFYRWYLLNKILLTNPLPRVEEQPEPRPVLVIPQAARHPRAHGAHDGALRVRHHRHHPAVSAAHGRDALRRPVGVVRILVRDGTVVVRVPHRHEPSVVDVAEPGRRGEVRAALAVGHDDGKRRAGHVGEEDGVLGLFYLDHGVTGFELCAAVFHWILVSTSTLA